MRSIVFLIFFRLIFCYVFSLCISSHFYTFFFFNNEECVPPCKNCVSRTHCTDCTHNYLLSQSGNCLCPEGYRDNSTMCVSISDCHEKCSTCIGSSDHCLQCSQAANRTDNPPFCDNCAPNATWVASLTQCIPCESQCKSCHEGYPSLCIECNNNNNLTQLPNPPPRCTECPPGTFYDKSHYNCTGKMSMKCIKKINYYKKQQQKSDHSLFVFYLSRFQPASNTVVLATLQSNEMNVRRTCSTHRRRSSANATKDFIWRQGPSRISKS